MSATGTGSEPGSGTGAGTGSSSGTVACTSAGLGSSSTRGTTSSCWAGAKNDSNSRFGTGAGQELAMQVVLALELGWSRPQSWYWCCKRTEVCQHDPLPTCLSGNRLLSSALQRSHTPGTHPRTSSFPIDCVYVYQIHFFSSLPYLLIPSNLISSRGKI